MFISFQGLRVIETCVLLLWFVTCYSRSVTRLDLLTDIDSGPWNSISSRLNWIRIQGQVITCQTLHRALYERPLSCTMRFVAWIDILFLVYLFYLTVSAVSNCIHINMDSDNILHSSIQSASYNMFFQVYCAFTFGVSDLLFFLCSGFVQDNNIYLEWFDPAQCWQGGTWNHECEASASPWDSAVRQQGSFPQVLHEQHSQPQLAQSHQPYLADVIIFHSSGEIHC